MTLADKPVVLYSALAYLGLMLLIGLWSVRRTRSARDFFIAGQRVGLVVTGLATMSAAFSGFVFIGGPGLTYRIGLASLMIVLPLGFTGGLLCWVLGRRLRALAARREIFTVPDAIQARFGSRTVSGLAAIAVLSGTVAYLGLQIQALGVVLQTVLGTDSLALAMLIGLGVVVAYSVVGGMVAGVYTDLIQGTLMMLAALIVFWQATAVNGGWIEMIAGVRMFGPELLAPLGPVSALTAFGFYFVFGVGVLGQPQMLHKFYMLREPGTLRWMPVILGASQAVCVLVWLGIGLAVPALVGRGAMAPLDRVDSATPQFLLQFAPGVVAGVAFAAILAAVMSTADSFVNIGSAALVRDLPRALGLRVRDELLWGRSAVVGVAAVAALFAWLYGDLIALLGTFAFGTFAAALAPALALGFTWPRVSAVAAGASIATGLVLNVSLEFLAKQQLLDWLPRPLPAGVVPSAVALAASFSVLYVVTLLGRRGDPVRTLATDLREIVGS